jgi:hypothetical protein
VHAVLGRPLWHPTAAIIEHLTWFMCVASAQVISAISDLPSSTDQLEIEVEEDNTIKPQNHSALTITDLLNPIQPTSPFQPRNYDSDSESSQSGMTIDHDGSAMLTYD